MRRRLSVIARAGLPRRWLECGMNPRTLVLHAALAALPTLALAKAPPAATHREVVGAFFSVCVVGPNVPQRREALLARGGTPEPSADPAAQAYAFRIDGVAAHASFDAAGRCTIAVDATDVAPALGLLDRLLARWGLLGTAMTDRQPPPGATLERNVELVQANGSSALANRLVVWSTPHAPALPALTLTWDRYAHAPDPAAPRESMPQAVEAPPAPPGPGPWTSTDRPPSQDISGMAHHAPRFPEAAIKACAHGVVRLRVSVDATGGILDVGVDESSGNLDLDNAAVDASLQWTFNPGLASGKAVGGHVFVPVNFTNPCAESPAAAKG